MLTGSRCPTPITVTHLRAYGEAFDVTRLYIAMWLSMKRDTCEPNKRKLQR